EDGIIITRDDIVQVSPVKRRLNSSDSEDDQPVSEDKGIEGASTAANASKKKRADKDKIEEVVIEKEKRKRTAVSESDKVTKKP
ncbi:hypothetical protein A2U01_0087103, partial [Trifolium medium]|nr:hypothetical protein [Trifolium medium]